MTRAKGPGGKNRRRARNSNGQNEADKKQILFKDTDQEYAEVMKMLGNGRCECRCFDGKTRLGHIRGKMRRRCWIVMGDIVLVALRDFQDDKVDIIHKYTADEAKSLKGLGEVPHTVAEADDESVDLEAEPDEAELEVDFDAI